MGHALPPDVQAGQFESTLAHVEAALGLGAKAPYAMEPQEPVSA